MTATSHGDKPPLPAGATPNSAATLGLTSRQVWVIFSALLLGTVLSAVDNTIVSTALPTIVGEFGGLTSIAWVGTAYILTSTIATPILGKLGDLYGRKRVMLAAIVMLLVGSLFCALSRNMGQLIAARGVQGLGGGGIQALTFAILGDLVSPRERGRYMGAFTSIFVVAGVSGPLIGGWMIERFAWQWIFLINLPIGAIAIAAIVITLKLPRVTRTAKLDLAGAFLLSASLCLLIVALERGRSGWLRPTVLGLFASAIVVFAAFVRQERRASEPLVPLHLFRNGIFRTAAVLGFLAGGLAYGTQQFVPLYFQSARFTTATVAGLSVVPIMLGVMFGSLICGRLITKTGVYKRYPIRTLIGSTLGAIGLTRFTPDVAAWQLFIPMFTYGFGVSTTFTTTSVAAQNAIDYREIGVGTATLASIRTLGGSFCLAIFGTLHATIVTSELRRRAPDAVAPGVSPTKLIRRPEEIEALPPAVRDAVVEALSIATSRVFLAAAVVAAIAVVVAFTLEERPLR